MQNSRSLQDLEIEDLPESNLNSRVITECRRLFKLPLSKLDAGDLRLLIVQNIGLQHLVPLALDKLEENPLIYGGLYAGDLLSSLINLSSEFWSNHPDLNDRVVEIKFTVESLAETLNNDILPKLSKFEFG